MSGMDLSQGEIEKSMFSRVSTITRQISKRGFSRLSGEITRVLGRKPAGGFFIHIDLPADGTPVSATLKVLGWAVSDGGQVARVEAFIEGLSLGFLECGLERADVAKAYPHPQARYSGFKGVFSLAKIGPGPHNLVIRATDTAGNSQEQSLYINNIPARKDLESEFPDEPAAVIEKAAWRGNLLEVEGWAAIPSSVDPVTARVFLDEEFVCQARVHLSRPDKWWDFNAYPNYLRSGFRVSHRVEKRTGTALQRLNIEFTDREGRLVQCQTHLALSGQPNAVDSCQWEQVMAEYQERYGQPTAILDWFSKLSLAESFGEQLIFTPPASAAPELLPYIDGSIDLVVVSSNEEAHLAEARRVASKGIIRLGAAWDEAALLPVQVEWLDLFPPQDRRLPGCSVIIPSFNAAGLLDECLGQLLVTLPGYLDVEILVIDDASVDGTPGVAGKWAAQDGRVKYHRNPQNLGFLRSANRGAELAAKEVVLFLNNDTLTRPGWLEPLLRVLKEQPEAGAVGGKLIYPDGLLQEAGGIIFSDGEGWNFGRYDPQIDRPVYNYVREVDYCSGAFLATWRELFLEDGGFDLRYVPMYYEDVDYCFRLRARGRKVFYQPESVVVHLEGGTAGTDITRGFKKYQAINYTKFVEKWQDVLKGQPTHPTNLDLATALDLAVRPATPASPAEVAEPLTLQKR